MSSLSKLKLRVLGRRRSVTPISNLEVTPYASTGDFCLVFMKNMQDLYLLSYVLTGDYSLAEKCFVNGLDHTQESNPVFKEWARSWATRTIIQRAIHMIQPETRHNTGSKPASAAASNHTMTLPPEITNIVGLPKFERFVFVITVLERYSTQECSLLLNCSRGDVIAARTLALQRIVRPADLQCKVVSIHPEKQMLSVHRASVPKADGMRGSGSGLLGRVPRTAQIDWDDHALAANRGT